MPAAALWRLIAAVLAGSPWRLVVPGGAYRVEEEQAQGGLVGEAAAALNGFVCPDAFTCVPAPCDVKNSNREPGLGCRCRDGFFGNVTWSGPIATGDCRPVPCTVKNSSQTPGPSCRCLDGFAGEIAWTGQIAVGECRPAPCNVPFSNRKPGLECRCEDSAEGRLRWVRAKVKGQCVPAPCRVKNSNRLPGNACACDAYSRGPAIVWKAGKASGRCREAPVELVHLFDEESVMRYNGQEFKCCVSSMEAADPKIVDLSSKELKRARKFGHRRGCGRLLGDTWHGARRSNSCKMSLGAMAEAMNIPREVLTRLVRWEDLPGSSVAGSDPFGRGRVAVQYYSATQCEPGGHGPPCDSDEECLAFSSCVRCAGSGYCTDVPSPSPSPSPPPSPSETCFFPPDTPGGSYSLPSPETWKYLMVPYDDPDYGPDHGEGASKFLALAYAPELRDLCLEVFPGGTPPVSSAIADSQPACVISHNGTGHYKRAVYYAEYNTERNIPNLIAYRIPPERAHRRRQSNFHRDWGPAQEGFDTPYPTLAAPLDECCWCNEANRDAEPSCSKDVSTRGHMATMTAFQPDAHDMMATNVYLNTVPTRQPFDGGTWNNFETANIERAKSDGLFVVAGPSLQTAGTLTAKDGTEKEVPVWVWSAYADLTTGSTNAHICSNGNDGSSDPCACITDLNGAELEKRIGFVAFPGLRSVRPS